MSKNPFQLNLPQRPRRNRRTEALRSLVRETVLTADNFIWPVFIEEGQEQKAKIASMPDCYRYSPDVLLKEIKELLPHGLQGIALFPALPESQKSPTASEALNPTGLVPQTVKVLKDKFPELTVITDIALDPFSSDGHDGLVRHGEILNDETVEILGEMARVHAQAGADLVAPSDMMDGRVGYLRQVLDGSGFENTGILSYSAKYASSFYGPFREALDSAPRSGDKKTYQMDPANGREALREIQLDIAEGADIVMVKPALAYLDVISQVAQISSVPIAAYNVSGEYSLVKAAALQGWVDEKKMTLEILTAIKRAGAQIIFSYHTPQVLKWLGN